MKNNIYEKLNDLEIEYEEVPLNDLEKQKLKNSVKFLKKNSRKSFYKKVATVAAALALVFGISNYTTDGYVMAKAMKVANRIEVNLKDSMMLSSDVENYSVKLNEPFEIDGEKYVLNDLLIDEDILYTVILHLDANSDSLDANSDSLIDDNVDISSLRVNGKKNKIIGSTVTSFIAPGLDNYRVITSMTDLKKPIENSGEIELKIYFDKFLQNKNKVSITVNVDMDDMKMEKRVVAEDMKIKGTDFLKLKSFTMSPAAQKITLTYPSFNEDYIFSIKAKTEDRKIIEFDTRNSDKQKSELYFSPFTSDLTADELLNYKGELNCQLYRQILPKESGKIDTPIEKYGEEFTISIK